MHRPTLRLLSLLIATHLLLGAQYATAQDDRRAGLFTEARQLPLVSQAMTVRIAGGEAELTLSQVFVNDGDAVAQADYHLYLPDGAVVTGYGFWNDGEFFAAQLQEKTQAEAKHHVAAGEGRATTLLKTDAPNIHSFSVYPVPPNTTKKVELTITLPVERELGRYQVKLPVDEFLGQPGPETAVVVELASEERVAEYGIEPGRARTIDRRDHSVRLALSTRTTVSVWWAEDGPPLHFGAEAVALDDGTVAVQVRAVFNRADAWRRPWNRLEVLVDGSYSMRRRTATLHPFLERLQASAPGQVDFHVIGNARREAEVDGARAAVEAVRNGLAGHRTRGGDYQTALDALGCANPEVRCVVVTDPQLDGLDELGDSAHILLLADVHERAYYAGKLPDGADIHLLDVESEAHLLALADALVLPVLTIETLRQDGTELTVPGDQRRRVAEGGVLRLFVEVPGWSTIELSGTIDGRPIASSLDLRPVAAETATARAIRRGLFREVLAGWMEAYRRHPDGDLKQRIVEVSLREAIPTMFTALQVDDPRLALPPTATNAGLLLRLAIVLALAAALVLPSFGVGRSRA